MSEHSASSESMIPKKLQKKTWVFIAAGFVILAVVGGAGVAYGYSFREKVLPGVHIGEFDLGSMTRPEVVGFLEGMHMKLLSEGIAVSLSSPQADKVEFVLHPEIIGSESVTRLIDIDIEKSADQLVQYGKPGNPLGVAFAALRTFSTQPHISVPEVHVDEAALETEIERSVAPYITPTVNAGIEILDTKPLEYEITPSSPGITFPYEPILGEITDAWSEFRRPLVTIEAGYGDPSVLESDVQGLISLLPQAFTDGSIAFVYTDESIKRDYKWSITTALLANWIEVVKDDTGTHFALSSSSTRGYIAERILPTVEVEARNARFSIGENGKVTEFARSGPGVTIDMEETERQLQEAFATRFSSETSTTEVSLITVEVQPEIATGDVNDLGITEVLGVGHSIFKGSPGARLKNIKHATFNKLNGLLVKPGETFSLLAALRPFTIAGGYLPELVIKGDKLTPEVGGGLCQIGTTMFRAAMNSGLEIAERRNHSLMVSYYNDLSNGNPGTDATIYDPAPDFKFTNDTGHHILISTELNDTTGDLYFTLWGTSDGRKGYYIPPTVSRWIPVGPTRIIETTTLPPGKKECQHAYPGAEASFTYVREMPDGEKKEQVFTSYYRPLPEICLVGAEKSVETPENSSEFPIDSPEAFVPSASST